MSTIPTSGGDVSNTFQRPAVTGKPGGSSDPVQSDEFARTQTEAAPVSRAQVLAAAGAGANPLSTIPTDMVPLNTSKFGAYAGLSWTFSKHIADATIERKEDSINLTSDKGNASIVLDAAHPGHVKASANGQTFSGTLSARPNGFSAKSDDGKQSIDLDRDGNHIDVHTHGFGTADSIGLFLKKS